MSVHRAVRKTESRGIDKEKREGEHFEAGESSPPPHTHTKKKTISSKRMPTIFPFASSFFLVAVVFHSLACFLRPGGSA